MTKPTAPANLADVSTWTPEQMAYAAPLIAAKAAAAASDTSAQAREMRFTYPEGFIELAKSAERYLKEAAFWKAVAAGENPKVPTFLKAQRVRSYEQTNKRFRPSKTRFGGNKDWGVFTR